MHEKHTIISAVAALVLVAGLAYVLVSSNQKLGSGGPGTVASSTASEGSKTVQQVPPGTVVPDVNSTDTLPDVAKPTSVGDIGGIKIQNFRVAIANEKVSPANVIVYVGTAMNITFSSDKEYGFVQPENGLSWSVPAGGSVTIQFQGNQPGKFIYYCKSCGGPAKGPIGYFVAVPR